MAAANNIVDLPGEIEVSGAESERQRVLSIFENPDASMLEIEIHGTKFTQPALQILFATLRTASESHHAYRLGPNANALLKARLDTVTGVEP